MNLALVTECWCAGRGLAAMPATPATVCAHLTDFAAYGVAAGTIECACAGIAAAHETEGEPSQTRVNGPLLRPPASL